jgi:hypothetical protein
MIDDQPKRGRPSDYCFQLAISICARKSLRAICSEAGMPGKATVFRWIARHKEFRDEYTLACELRAEDLADEMIEIADDPCVWVAFNGDDRWRLSDPRNMSDEKKTTPTPSEPESTASIDRRRSQT